MATIIEWPRPPPGANSNRCAIWPVAAKRFAIFAMSGYQHAGSAAPSGARLCPDTISKSNTACIICTWHCTARSAVFASWWPAQVHEETLLSRKAGSTKTFPPGDLQQASHCRVGPSGQKTQEANMSWKVEVVMDDSGEWECDSLRFATQQEAVAYAA